MSFTITRGVNLTGWMTPRKFLERFRRHKRTLPLGRDDLYRIVDWGFDHVRLPMYEVDFFEPDSRKISRSFDRLDRVLDWCFTVGLRVVADLHRIRDHNTYTYSHVPDDLFGNAAKLDRFLFLWSELSSSLRARPNDMLAYDLLNEVYAFNPEDWNRVLGILIAHLRTLEPERMFLIGPNRNRDLGDLHLLRIPDDQHLILAFHFYRPMWITHYRLAFSKVADYAGPVQYPGQPIPEEAVHLVTSSMWPTLRNNEHWNRPWDRQVMAAWLAEALQLVRQREMPLYCAEFGCTLNAPAPFRQAWFRDWMGVLIPNRIGFCLWEYRGGFGLLGPNGKPSDILPIVLAAQ